MLCQRCGTREAEIFQTQHVGDRTYTRDLCAECAKIDYGIFLGALLHSQTPGAAPMSAEEEKELRRVLDEAAPHDEES